VIQGRAVLALELTLALSPIIGDDNENKLSIFQSSDVCQPIQSSAVLTDGSLVSLRGNIESRLTVNSLLTSPHVLWSVQSVQCALNPSEQRAEAVIISRGRTEAEEEAECDPITPVAC
jgi:hypothetical protein